MRLLLISVIGATATAADITTVAERQAGVEDGVRQGAVALGALADEYRINGLSDAQADAAMAEVRKRLAAMVAADAAATERSLPWLTAALTQAARRRERAGLEAVGRGQDWSAEELTALVRIARARFGAALSGVEELVRRQQAVLDRTIESANTNVGKRLEQLAPDARERLDRIGGDQAGLAELLAPALAALAAQAAAEADAAARDRLAQLIREIEAERLDAAMGSAAADLRDNRLPTARTTQERILARLRAALAALAQSDPAAGDAAALGSFIERQQQLLDQLKAMGKQPPAEAMNELALAEAALAAAVAETAPPASPQLQAAEAMNAAVSALASGTPLPAEQQMQAALLLLQQAMSSGVAAPESAVAPADSTVTAIPTQISASPNNGLPMGVALGVGIGSAMGLGPAIAEKSLSEAQLEDGQNDAATGGAWTARLPERSREALKQGAAEPLPPRYEQQVADYYDTLARGMP